MFTKEDANKFLTNHLKFPTWKQVLDENKLVFLRLFVRKHVTYMPYQNITACSVIPKERHCPTHAEFIADGVSGKAGVCISLNYFAQVVLDAIGFDTFAIEGDCPLTPFPGDHYMVVVNLDGQQYLVDVGMFHPVYDVIPLDPAQMPYRRVMCGFPYEYRYCSETETYTRHHLEGGCNNGRFKNDKEQVTFMVFKLTPKKLGDFHKTMTKVYSDPASGKLRTFFLSRFLEISENEMRKENANPGYAIIHGTTLSVGDINTREETAFETLDQVVPSIMKYFPKSDPAEIKKAIEAYTLFKENNANIK